MTLDSSVMNVSMPQVAEDVGTTITGIQTAITLYTLVMATMMITGGKLGSIMGRRRAFALGLMIYGAGSFVTALAQSLPVLLLGWSLLEGLGAALIMPAIVALVAGNFPPRERSRAYGLVAAAGAMAVAAGPLIGGAVTTYASWRFVFLGEVVIVVAILAVVRQVKDVAPEPASLDVVGALLSIVALSLIVLGALKSSEWGWVIAKPGAPSIGTTSAVIWMIVGGLLVGYVFFLWINQVAERGGDPLVKPFLFANRQLTGGLTMFFAQFSVQAGVFFAVPLFLSVVLGLNALETGVRILPLSIALLVAAAGIPRVRPQANPRRVVRIGLSLMVAGTLLLMAGMDPGAGAAVVSVPLLLLGLGMGALSSQLGAVTVSAVPDKLSAEVGGLQNTATNLGASLGTALIGSVLIATLTTSMAAGIQANPDVPASVKEQASVQLSDSMAFVSDAQLSEALAEAGVEDDVAQEILDTNAESRLDALRAAFALAAVLGSAALFFTGRVPRTAPGGKSEEDDEAEERSPEPV